MNNEELLLAALQASMQINGGKGADVHKVLYDANEILNFFKGKEDKHG